MELPRPVHNLLPISAALASHGRAFHNDSKEGAMKTPENPVSGRKPRRSEENHLNRQYGEIGISAVAAAVRYQGSSKNPAYAPAAVPPAGEEVEDLLA